jgi:exodeoxyribonuclease V alpha subunit
MEDIVEGYIEHIIYRNEDNGYTVLNLSVDGEDVTCVGSIPLLSEGEYVEFKGEYITHAVYGQQLKIKSFQIKMPSDLDAIERYLGSGAIKGVGTALAGRIVRKFKEDTFRIMEEEPERLAEVKGISIRIAQEIAAQVEGRANQRQAIMFLQEYGINLQTAVKIYAQYHEKVYEIIRNNPYQLAEDMEGIGFKTADEIAIKAGIKKDSEFRIRSGILYTLMLASQEGHTFLPKSMLTARCSNLLQVEESLVEEGYMDLQMERKIVCKTKEKEEGELTEVYLSLFFSMENNSAALLDRLNVDYALPDIEMEARIRTIEKETEQCLDEMQVKAIKEAAGHGLFLLTGGPGTGKTTTINAIIRYFKKDGLEIRLAAPTGRAAKRMSEMTGEEASTIHRMLEVSGGLSSAEGYGRNEENPIDADAIIIDEMSMVDISLMYALLKAITIGTRLILVGDTNQLPSVGAGNVFKDLIESGAYPTVRLTKIFRQAQESDIILNAHKINEGEKVSLDNKSKDFFFLKRYDANKIINVVLQLVYQKLPKYTDADPMEIQVLTPTRKGLLGVDNLNRVLQMYLNPKDPKKREKTYGDTLFREGDKVMQVKNNYQQEWEVLGKYGIPIEKGTGIFNGDMGVIREINDFAGQMTIEFDDRHTVEYSYKMLDELELAYAITIHKSQGSEYPAVVIPLLGGPRMLLNRNLLYTAVTRAKKCVVLVGSDATFEEMENNTMQQKRFSGLKDRILEN